MKKVVLPSLALSFIFLLWTDINACGDKFLVVGRGIRYERAYAAKYPGSILIYSENKDGIKDLQSMLKKSGHKIETVGEETKLFSTLQSSKYDVVIVGLSDVTLLEKKVIATPSKPAVLPIIYNVTGAELNAAKSQYSCVLKYSNKNKNAVAVIDEVMEARKKGKPIACNWTK